MSQWQQIERKRVAGDLELTVRLNPRTRTWFWTVMLRDVVRGKPEQSKFCSLPANRFLDLECDARTAAECEQLADRACLLLGIEGVGCIMALLRYAGRFAGHVHTRARRAA